MKVSHTTDFTTSAVIGSQEVTEMGISNNQEFMQILASTLYTYPMIAFIRETLSNHWDAHIEAGKTNVPIQVEITKTHYIVKDTGYGIAADKFGVIYGTFGKGTKENDEFSIGGFGLGCKSPHAYTDTFEVTSCHNGVKSVYSIVKASRQADGKNAIIRLVQVPTTETGLTVKVPIKAADHNRIRGLVKSFVYAGDILCELNGELLPTIGISFTPEQCYLVEDTDSNISRIDYLNTPVLIRYANILYPLGIKRDEYPELYDNITEMVSFEPRDGYIIVQAHPNSLSLNPSRESISMTDYSVNSLNKLLGKACANLLDAYEAATTKLNNSLVQQLQSMPLNELTPLWADHIIPYSLLKKILEEVLPTMSEYSAHLASVWQNRSSDLILSAVEADFYSKYASAPAKWKEAKFDIALMKQQKGGKSKFTYVYRKIIKLVDSLGMKHIAYYRTVGDAVFNLTKYDDTYFGSRDRIVEVLKRKVVIARTAKEFQAACYHKDMLLIRYNDATNQAKLIAALTAAEVEFEDLTGDIPIKESNKASLPKVADFLDGVPVWSTPEKRASNVDILVTPRNTGNYADYRGHTVHAHTLRVLRDLGVVIGVVPTLTIAKSLGKRWNIPSIATVATKTMLNHWGANKEKWLNNRITSGTVIRVLRPLYEATIKLYYPDSYITSDKPMEYISHLIKPNYADFKYSYPKNTRDGCEFVEDWLTVLHLLQEDVTYANMCKQELGKPITLADLPEALLYRTRAAALWNHWDALSSEDFVNDELFMSFINKQLRKLENEYKNKRGSCSRNYGYYHPVQARR